MSRKLGMLFDELDAFNKPQSDAQFFPATVENLYSNPWFMPTSNFLLSGGALSMNSWGHSGTGPMGRAHAGRYEKNSACRISLDTLSLVA